MVSYLIISQDKLEREEYAMQFCRDKGIDQFDITILERSKVEKKDTKKVPQSLGIEDIKQLQKKLSFRPLRGVLKACVIRNAQLLTIEAQNAMLKLLEEPPPQTLIFLTADTKEAFLPTILSRCQLIDIHIEENLTEDKKEEIKNQLSQLINTSTSSALAFAEIISKNKEETLVWLKDSMITLREELLEGITNEHKPHANFFILKQFQETYTILKTTNVNTRFAIENLFLSLL